MLTRGEKKALADIERWQAKKIRAGIAPALINLLFHPLETITRIVVPDAMIKKVSRPLAELIVNLESVSHKFARDDAVVRKAQKAGLRVEKLEDLRRVPLRYLDVLSRSFLEKSALYATAQGMGMGAGGYATALIDLPMLFTQNLKMIFQIGASYGYPSDTPQEKEFALRIFCITTASEDDQDAQMRRMDELVRSLVEDTFAGDTAILSSPDSVAAFVNRIVSWFVRKRSLRGVFFIGMALGSTLNYFYTKETATYAYMFYRKRFLQEKLA
jgi:hypothetical protein